MRTLLPRPSLPSAVLEKLAQKTAEILAHQTPSDRAEQVFDSSRGAKWFSPVVEALASHSGIGQRCMVCSGSESSQIEHFRPKRAFPGFSMTWENFLWSCGICNQNKGNRFPTTVAGEPILNPLDDNVWDYCFIDEYGNLTALWDVEIDDLDKRASLTISTFGLDRETLQETRQSRIRNLHELIAGAMQEFNSGSLDSQNLRERIEVWLSEPYQPDVADYFLRGPGRTESPFSQIVLAAGCQ